MKVKLAKYNKTTNEVIFPKFYYFTHFCPILSFLEHEFIIDNDGVCRIKLKSEL